MENYEHPNERPSRIKKLRALANRTAPIVRDLNRFLDQHTSIEQIHDKAIDKAHAIAHSIDEAVANFTAIEVSVVDQQPIRELAPSIKEQSRLPHRIHYMQIAIVASASLYGALKLQRDRFA